MACAMLNIALKEWSIVCDLMMEGRLSLLLRKGGIHEDRGPGEFRLEHPHFGLFPSWAHQKPQMVKEPFRRRVQVMEEPANITVAAIGQAERIWEVPSRTAFDRLDDLHCWTPEQIDMRFNYKPDHPLYLVAVRCALLPQPKTVVNDWSYGGCKSWVPLKPQDAIDPTGATPALDDETFAQIIDRVNRAFT